MALFGRQNRAAEQGAATIPDMPGYTSFETKPFSRMVTEQDQIWWLYSQLSRTVSDSEVADVESQLAELQKTLDEIKNGQYVYNYIDQLAGYIDANLQDFVARIAMYAFPGFYWDGYAWRYQIIVPESWTFLKFRWVWVEDDMSYHIMLTWGDFASTSNVTIVDEDTGELSHRVSVLENGLVGERDARSSETGSLQRSVNYQIGYRPEQ